MACRVVDLQWTWTKGHAGEVGNEVVDAGAYSGRS